MNIRKWILSALASSVVMWALAGIWHKLAIPLFSRAEDNVKHEGTAIIALAYLILAVLMAYVYPKGYQGGKPSWEGLKFGVLMGILWVFPHSLAMAGAHDESIAYVFQNAAWHVVEQGIGGIVIALIYGKSALSGK
ncbi:MAG: hypothetical protein OEZ36_00580 [Spirochaetota bacterium]|nr:hypothetical protein [Spirochaetota bacterium]